MTSSSEHLRLAMYCTGCIPGYQLPCFSGMTQDIFRRHGLRVEVVDPDGGPANVHAVSAGRRDLCLTSVAHYLAACGEDPDVQARFVFMVARHTHMAAFVVRDRVAAHGRPIRSHADLEGATLLGDPGSSFNREYGALLGLLGVTPGAPVEVPYAQIGMALAEGRGDVAADFVDLLPRFQAAADPYGVEIVALPFHEAGIDIYGSGLVAGTRLLRERPQTARTVVEAFREALVASRDDPELGLQALLEQIPDADPGLVVAGWRAGAQLIFDEHGDVAGRMDREKWQRTIDFHARAYGTPDDIDPLSVFDDVRRPSSYV
jgi:ABC-type nitrate/sulfonate/bicarbonate transport system substrate-binding protein